MKRIDEISTKNINGLRCAVGKAMPFGAEVVGDKTVNFSIYSKDATGCELLLFHIGEEEPFAVFEFTPEYRIGGVFSVMIFDLDWEKVEYGYRFNGPSDFKAGFRFDKTKTVLDPYAKLVSGHDKWHTRKYDYSKFPFRGRIIREDFNWEGDTPLNVPMKDLVIYEMHVRGFTCDKSSKAKFGGTFAGVIEKIPYLKELGINCVQLLPIFEFEEFYDIGGPEFTNFWGYMPVNYFSPKSGYARSGVHGLAVDELKNMIKQLHKNGISVILDVVFNHTAEGDHRGDTISFRGVDNRTYYVMDNDGNYLNLTGSGNTVNCNNPIVRNFILDSMRYWVSSYHVDGFRIDEAPIFSRNQDGTPMVYPPLVDTLANDPILGSTKLISEGWDASGLCTIGKFPNGWADWNPRYRDSVKRFIKGSFEDGPSVISAIAGSPDLFGESSPAASINYLNCHDGMTLFDTVAYNNAHNEANPFPTPMSSFNNNSWNCGEEGETDNEEVISLRKRQMKNMISILLLSRGVPMFCAGDEFANTQYGNNDAYCHDSIITWLDWKRLKKYKDVHEYFCKLISFRKNHPVLRKDSFDTGNNSSGYPELSWHGEKAWNIDTNGSFLNFGFMYVEPQADFGTEKDSFIYCAVNAHWEDHSFELPIIPEGMKWKIFAYTGDPDDRCCGNECFENVTLMQRSVMILVGGKEN